MMRVRRAKGGGGSAQTRGSFSAFRTPHPAFLSVVALLATLAVRAAEGPPQKSDPAVARLEAFRPKLWSKDRAEREKAYEALLAEGEAGRRKLIEELQAIRTAAIAACRELALGEDTQKKLREAHAKLAEARKEALRVIFDRTIYPDANHGRAGQPTVDKAVDAVKAAHPSYRRAFDPVVRRIEPLPRILERLKEADALLEKLGASAPEPTPPVEKLLRCDPELLKLLQNEAAYVSLCEKVLRYNRLIRTSATADERRVVELTNEYRMQLGLRPLAISEPLTQAARKHSQEMQRLGYFAHNSPTPENRTPQQRCLNEGYRHFAGENCASGPAAPQGAFNGWYNSSGHHRNMLGGHTEMAVGRAGNLWTELLGNRPDLDLDNPPRTLPRPAPPPAKK